MRLSYDGLICAFHKPFLKQNNKSSNTVTLGAASLTLTASDREPSLTGMV